MVKIPRNSITQAYLARRPTLMQLVWGNVGQEIVGYGIRQAGHFIFGRIGKEGIDVFQHPDQMLENFANVLPNADDVLRFTKRYGVLRIESRERIDYVSRDPSAGGFRDDDFFFSVDSWLDKQTKFRRFWEGYRDRREEMAQLISRELELGQFEGSALRMRIASRGQKFDFRMEPRDLWQSLCLMLISFDDRPRKCQNSTCLSPYFIATRRDQKYCSEECSRLVANRKWWNKSGDDWRKNQKKGQPKQAKRRR